MPRPLPLLLLLSLSTAVAAQSSRPATSTVTGHVYCSDTNAPARLAMVMLEPAPMLQQSADTSDASQYSLQRIVSAVYTDLDGAFVMYGVPPGDYYVVTDKPGYVIPSQVLPATSLLHPSADEARRIAALMPRLTITGGVNASVDVRLERGAALTGTVLFDDGSPAANLPIHVLVRRNDKGRQRWDDLPSTPRDVTQHTATDDLGHYRVAGLPAGTYTVRIDLQMHDLKIGLSTAGRPVSWGTSGGESVSFYAGDTARKANAAAFALGPGEERGDEDITIPISKLHTVSGHLLAAHDGHILNSGDVELEDPDDTTKIASASVNRDDDTFHLFFVPEGTYVLHVSGAADAKWEPLPTAPGSFSMMDAMPHIQKWYGTTNQPLQVHEDMTDLTVSVPDRARTRRTGRP